VGLSGHINLSRQYLTFSLQASASGMKLADRQLEIRAVGLELGLAVRQPCNQAVRQAHGLAPIMPRL